MEEERILIREIGTDHITIKKMLVVGESETH
jgi:hypothetical protein